MNISQRLRTCARHTGLDAVIELLQEAADEIDAQQARAALTQQPATGEPVMVQHRKPVEGWSGETIGYTAWRDGKGLDWWPHRELYDRPAPSVPDDAVRDAERYRWLRASTFPKADQYPYRISTKPIRLPIGFDDQSTFDAAIDAAMLAAK